MLRRWQRMLRAEDAALTQRIRSVMQATTGHTAPHTVNRRPGAAHVRGRVRAAELLPVSQWRSVHVRRAAEHAAAHSVLRDARALDSRELVGLVVLTERVAAPEGRCVHVRLPARDSARLPGQRDALALRVGHSRDGGTQWKRTCMLHSVFTEGPHKRFIWLRRGWGFSLAVLWQAHTAPHRASHIHV